MEIFATFLFRVFLWTKMIQSKIFSMVHYDILPMNCCYITEETYVQIFSFSGTVQDIEEEERGTK